MKISAHVSDVYTIPPKTKPVSELREDESEGRYHLFGRPHAEGALSD
jgi:hypothetical protein